VLVNVTLIALVLCSLPDFDVLYLLDPPYKTTPSFPSVFRKINIQKVGNLTNSVINFVITESNAEWPNTD